MSAHVDVPSHVVAASAALPTCQVHPVSFRHHPAPAGVPDFHHLLPRDWQRAWTPDGATVVTTRAYGAVWEPAGVYVTPLCHRNVHVGIEALVHAWRSGDSASTTFNRVRAAHGHPILDAAEWSAAQRALELWGDHGGDVAFLQAHHLWGAQ